jgi:hypothetical protein
MSGAERRASLDERVSWTTGFTRPADKVVLGAIAFYADFETGHNARPGMHNLVARADLPKRTVERSLRRLLDEGWIVITDARHLGATTYAVMLERLATSRAHAKLVAGRAALSANLADKGRAPLSANLAGLSANLAGAVRQCGGRTRDQYPGSSTQEHRRAAPASITATTEPAEGALGMRGHDGLATDEGPTLAARAGDVSTNARDRADVAADRSGRGPTELDRVDQATPCGARVQLPDRSDSPRDRRADGPGPVQQSFGPLALGADDFAPIVAAAEPRQVTHLVTLGDVWRANLEARRKRAASS